MATKTANQILLERLARARAGAAAKAVQQETKAEQASEITPVPSQTNLSAPSRIQKVSVVNMDNVGEDGKYAGFKKILQQLEDDLNNEVPDFAQQLRKAYSDMSQDPNVLTVLSEKEIGLIVAGLGKHRDITVVAAKKGSTKRTQPLDLDDI